MCIVCKGLEILLLLLGFVYGYKRALLRVGRGAEGGKALKGPSKQRPHLSCASKSLAY